MSVDPATRELAARARFAIEAAEAAGLIPADRAEWMAMAAQDVVDGRVASGPGIAGVRLAIAERASEMICVGPDVLPDDIPL